MRYKNATGVLPQGLIDEIQRYVQGEYIYIPIREKTGCKVPTEYATELQKRDGHCMVFGAKGYEMRRGCHENFCVCRRKYE